MPIIRTRSDLKNRLTEIQRICHERQEPIFITKRGRPDMVIVGKSYYDQMYPKIKKSRSK